MTATTLLDVLIVDDSAAIRKILQRVLRQTDLPLGEIHEAGDGTEAVVMLQNRRFGLILSDINMPGMSGIELLGKIRDEYDAPPPVVMMITAYGDDENRNQAMQNGANDFLTKPLDFNLLKEKLKTLTENGQDTGS